MNSAITALMCFAMTATSGFGPHQVYFATTSASIQAQEIITTSNSNRNITNSTIIAASCSFHHDEIGQFASKHIMEAFHYEKSMRVQK
mmetsp:Transcript_7374/g.21608  ORF Transcript_7374/g.21608 Transcript_7374/m.21608 type:complete len:88 (+) Transcript_7374:287-550(+)